MKAKLFLGFLFIFAGLASHAALADEERPITLVALGTSLTAGFGLPPEDGFTEQLSRSLAEQGVAVKIHDAGVSGDTSSGGLARLDWAVGPDTDGVIVELGSNDALRGLDPAQTEKNLREILTRLQSKKVPVLLAGMRSPPNLGPEYAADFEPIFEKLALEFGTLHYPFFLDGVAAQPDLNQADGIHPNAEGVAIIVERIAPSVVALVDKAKERSRNPLPSYE